MTTSAEQRELLVELLIKYANVPAKEAKVLAETTDEATIYATEAELLADTPVPGTLAFAEDTGVFKFARDTGWDDAPNTVITGGGGGDTVTETYLSFPIDYATGTDPVAGTVFKNQTEIDDYLVANSITHFKHIMACWEATPVHILHDIYFQLAAGIHRPRNPEAAPHAWTFSSYGTVHKVFHPEAQVFVNGENVNVGNWNEIVASQSVVSFDNLNEDPKVQVSGTPYTAGALKGYFVLLDSSPNVPYVINDNTADTLYLSENVPGSPTTAQVISPATILRNSYNDTSIAKNDAAVLFRPSQGEQVNGLTSMEGRLVNVRVDNFSSRAAVELQGGCAFYLSQSLIDQAGLKDAGINWTGFGVDASSGSRVNWYRSGFRGRGLASTPSTDSNAALNLYGSKPDYLAGTIERSYIGGGGTAGCMSLNNSWIKFSSGVMGDCQSHAIQAVNSWLEIQTTVNTKRTTIRNVTSGNGILLTANCLMPPAANTSDANAIDCTFDAIGGAGDSAILVGSNCQVRLDDVKDAGTPMPGNALRMFGERSQVYATLNTTIAGTSGDVRYDNTTGNVPMSWADLTARKRCSTQPVGNLKGFVEILGVEDGSANGQGTLTFTLSGTTLAWAENGDTAGSAVNVSGGGYFTLASNNGKTIRVYVTPTLPGANQSDNAILAHNALLAREAGSYVSKPF